MGHLVTEDLDRRLRATAPEIEAQAYDAALLERVRALPVEARSRRRRVAPLVALATAAVPPSSCWPAARRRAGHGVGDRRRRCAGSTRRRARSCTSA